MNEFIRKLFSSDFMPHGHCYLWKPEILWLNVGSDLLIAFSYFLIPLALIALVRQREDLVFDGVFVMFAAFIFACGSTHLFEIWTVWHGTYRLEGVIKLATGIISFTTAIVLWKLIPLALKIPSRQALERTQADLREIISSREKQLEEISSTASRENSRMQQLYKIAIDREHEMIRLKNEVNSLLSELNRQPKYEIVTGVSSDEDE